MKIREQLPESRMASVTIQFVNFIIMLEPAALGCMSAMLPDRPIP